MLVPILCSFFKELALRVHLLQTCWGLLQIYRITNKLILYASYDVSKGNISPLDPSPHIQQALYSCIAVFSSLSSRGLDFTLTYSCIISGK